MSRGDVLAAAFVAAVVGFVLFLSRTDIVAGAALLAAGECAAIAVLARGRDPSDGDLVAHAAVALLAVGAPTAEAIADAPRRESTMMQILVIIALLLAWGLTGVQRRRQRLAPDPTLPALRSSGLALTVAAWALVANGALGLVPMRSDADGAWAMALVMSGMGLAGLVAAGALVCAMIGELPRWAIAGCAIAGGAAVICTDDLAWVVRAVLESHIPARLPGLYDWWRAELPLEAIGFGIVGAAMLAKVPRGKLVRWTLAAFAIASVLAIALHWRRDALIDGAIDHIPEGLGTLTALVNVAIAAMAVAFLALVRAYRRALADAQPARATLVR